VAATCNLRSYQLVLPSGELFRIKARQGTVWPCVDFRAVDLLTGQEVPWDDHSFGELLVRGPWVARTYLGESDSGEKFADGWLHTGDIVMFIVHSAD
jgi:fatty-acyl-CoA synthase